MEEELKKKSKIIQRHLFTLKHEGRATPLMDKDKAARASKVHNLSCLSQGIAEDN